MWRRFSITYVWLCLISSTLIYIIRGHDVRSFDDTVHFKINWPGESTSFLVPDVELYPITTANHERYQCSMPYMKKPENSETESYTGPNPIEILSPLFMQNQCFHKLDSYWTYEICHGRYVRQYHEDREGKKIKLQEYYLGTYNKTQKLKLATEYEEREKNPNRKAEIPVKRVDSTNMPYVEIEMTDGTVCDLNSKPRKIKVLYVCSQDMQHEVYSLKETSSCEYEAIIRTSLLCNHPDYKPQDVGENEINCRPVDKARRKPKALTLMEMESMELRHQKVPGNDPHYVVIFHVDKEGQDGEPRVRVEIRPVDFPDQHSSNEDLLTPIASQLSPAEIDPVQNFLSSQNCLHGGNGWWKYEFCHGRYVAQYHVEKDGTKTTVDLGKFDKQKHVEWIIAHPNKKPSLSKKTLSHFYSDGSICDKTGKLRQTEVILKCVEMPSLSSVSLSLLEFKTCEYILKVESPIICGILEYADEYGLLDDNKIKMNFGKVQSTSYQIDQDDLNERIANGDD